MAAREAASSGKLRPDKLAGDRTLREKDKLQGGAEDVLSQHKTSPAQEALCGFFSCLLEMQFLNSDLILFPCSVSILLEFSVLCFPEEQTYLFAKQSSAKLKIDILISKLS